MIRKKQLTRRNGQLFFLVNSYIFSFRKFEIMKQLTRITFNPSVMGGKPCIRNMRVTVGMIVGLIASGHSVENILKAYPYLEKEDIFEALSYAAWRSEEREVPLASA